MKMSVYLLVGLTLLVGLGAGCALSGSGQGILVLPLGGAGASRLAVYDWSEFMPAFSLAEVTVTTSDGVPLGGTFTDLATDLQFTVPAGPITVQVRAVPDWAATAVGLTSAQQALLPTLAREYTASGTTTVTDGQTVTLQLKLVVSQTAVMGPSVNNYPGILRYAETIMADSPLNFAMGPDMYPSTLPYFRFDRFGRLFFFVNPSTAGSQHIVVWADPAAPPLPLLSSIDLYPWCLAYDELNNRIYAYAKTATGALLTGDGAATLEVTNTTAYYFLNSDNNAQPNVVSADRDGNLYLVMNDSLNSTNVLVRATVDGGELAVGQAISYANLGITVDHWIEDLQLQDGSLYVAVATSTGAASQVGFFLRLDPATLSLASLPAPSEAIVPRRFLGLMDGQLVFADAPRDGMAITVETVCTFDLDDGTVVRGASESPGSAATFLNMFYC
ncbi:MAG: hypothetical protein A2004_07490 [Spirochaetes bacterium GWC1_61_12]|nr:MAG: hypothetical protein A2Y37_09160 [Spirochaetes bacterium GWB1_60_80]OHD30898.1 MAG: hypothetical protein A2004_07490 [Spirochaetes bacterium GWC1_61_12]HAW85126.1 hypothetical protein [Spirochaetaceae bacterium]HBO41456.1 hypothetical protein [Spirochaetaceae bacterium]HCQ86244.1 hypothetical protein [Spirochaetaceae bacterium]